MEEAGHLDNLSQWLSNADKKIIELRVEDGKCITSSESVASESFEFNYTEEDKVLLLKNCALVLAAWRAALEKITEAGQDDIEKLIFVRFSSLNSDIAELLSSCIQRLKAVHHVAITHSKLQDDQLKLLLSALFCSKGLSLVDLSNNELTGEGLYSIYDTLTSESSLITLDVSNNPCKEFGGIRLLERQVPDFTCTFDEDYK